MRDDEFWPAVAVVAAFAVGILLTVAALMVLNAVTS